MTPEKRLEDMPERFRTTYRRAVYGTKGKPPTRKNMIKAMCEMCVGWEPSAAPDIRACTDPACPLYAARPYKVGRASVSAH